MTTLLDRRQVVVADFPARGLDAESLRRCARTLAGTVDATLAGDSATSRVQFSPSLRAALIRREGLAVWSGVNCRDRNRVALEGELAGLAEVGVAGVHCVTGDHTLTGSRPDAAPVFDLDSTELAALARAAGHLVSVAESPAAPPTAERAARLPEKERAGAQLCFVNHCGGVESVAAFIREVRRGGTSLRFIPCVPVVIDAGSAALLESFTTLLLPEGYLAGIRSAADPRRAGIVATVALCERMLELEGVAGVDLSGGPGRGGEEEFADALAEIAARLAL
ncbi:methylenetetrahydrofolate reductase [Agromyces bauzanensis]